MFNYPVVYSFTGVLLESVSKVYTQYNILYYFYLRKLLDY